AYAAACSANATEGKFVAQAVTWLNQRRWEDYRVVPKTADEIYAAAHPGWQPGMETDEQILERMRKSREQAPAVVRNGSEFHQPTGFGGEIEPAYAHAR